jgi:aspartate racemase
VELLERQLADLSPEQRLLVEYWLRHEQADAAAVDPARPIPRRRTTDAEPLSFAQQRLWFLHQLEPASPAYNLPAIVRLQGKLDVRALAQSLRAIIQRHEVLRTTFTMREDRPVQLIAATPALRLPLLDLQALPADTQDTTLLRLAKREARQPFDLARGPLLRTTLLRLAPDAHVLLVTIHHITSDGWSLGVLMRELAALYAASQAGRPAPLPPLPIQYADFAVWQRTRLRGTILAEQLAYWRTQLAGAPALLALPTDRPRPLVQTSHGTLYEHIVPEATTRALAALSQRAGVTLFMTLVAALQTLFARYSGQTDILVGTPIAGRTRAELEELIGCFVNMLVLRSDLSNQPRFDALLARVRATALAAYAHQELPFEQLVDALQPTRNLSYPPVFQVLCVLQNTPRSRIDLAGLTFQIVPTDLGTAQFDLSLAMVETPQGLTMLWEYNTDLFDPTTICRMNAHFQTLLAGVVADPTMRTTDLPLLSAAERSQLRVEWNAPQSEAAAPGSIAQLIAAQASRTPDAVALIAAEQHLTYRTLLQRASQLAQHLRAHGVGPESCVGLLIDRSLALIVGLLGILVAGAAYVPLDPADPPDRLAFLLKDSRARVLLVGTKDERRRTKDDVDNSDAAIVNRKSKIVNLDADWPQIAQAAAVGTVPEMRPDQLAYVIYTSGSTGRPKGVLITQQALATYAVVARAAYALRPDDRLLQFASASFDASAEEIFPSLISGVALVLRAPTLPTPADFLRTLEAAQLTVVNLPTAFWHELTRAMTAAGLALPAPVRLVIIGGEAALPAMVADWHRLATGHARLVNTYGPTEATIVATSCDLVRSAVMDVSPVAIGRPVRHAQTYILDDALQLVPIGVAGELFIGGAGLARGYLGRPDLTAERFVPNLFAEVAGAGCRVPEDKLPDTQYPIPATRLYRTGDLARYRADGTIEYLGRIDQQVKLRGYRIELGEIAAALRAHAEVQDAVVVARSDRAGDTRLVAYVVQESGFRVQGSGKAPMEQPTPDPRPLIPELRAHLEQTLPAYMQPAAFVSLDALPRTPSGKLDRAALPDPDDALPQVPQAATGPRTPLERQLVALWAEVLGRPAIGITDNFFEQGGHSLLALRLMARIAQQFGQELPLTVLFAAPTVAQLAARLAQPASGGTAAMLVAIQPQGTRRPFFCVHPGGGEVLCYSDLARQLGDAQPFYGLRAVGLDDEAAPHDQIATMAAAYLAALRTVQPHGPYQLGGWSLGGVVAYEMAQQLHTQGEAIGRLVLIDPSPLPGRGVPAAMDELLLLGAFAQQLGLPLAGLVEQATALRQLDPTERLARVLSQAQQQQVLPPELTLAQLVRWWAVFLAHERALQRYEPLPAAHDLMLYHATERTTALDPLPGWQALAPGRITLVPLPGEHFSLMRPPHVYALAEHLRRRLLDE